METVVGLEHWQISEVKKSSDQHVIRYGIWRRANNVNRILIYLNGRSEWIEKNFDLPNDLSLPNDVAILTLDHRGQGASAGTRGSILSYDIYVDDLIYLLKELNLDKYPFGLLAHSMGGLIAIYAVMQQRLKPAFLVSTSPLLGLPPKPIPYPMSWIVVFLLNSLGLSFLRMKVSKVKPKNLETNKLTHSSDFFSRIKDSPYELPGPSFAWLKATIKAIMTVHRIKNIEEYSIPTLLFFPQ